MNIRAEIFGGGTQKPLIKDKAADQTGVKALTDIAVRREETRRTNDRHLDRFRLSKVTVPVTYDGRECAAEVVNLSGGGAMIAASILPNIAERLHIHLGEGGTVECLVRWIKGGRLGLEFAHETQLQCSEDEQAALLREVIRQEFPDERFADPKAKTQVLDPSDQRSERRHPLVWWGDLHHGSHSWHVRLRNISATGALVECEGCMRIGSEVALDLGRAGSLTASVSWSVGDHVGLQFDEPFEMQRLTKAQPQVTSPKWLRPAYLGEGGTAESPWDEAWDRMSVDDLKTQLDGFLKR